MKHRTLHPHRGFSLLLGLALIKVPAMLWAQTPSMPEAARQLELVKLVREDCGSCHGRSLKGGLGPSLLPEDLRDLPSEALRETILKGRQGTAMPPWQQFLSEADANWIVEKLQSEFPDVK
ncbi:MAG: cytochrome c [Betaproteobacteria bacterium]|nr:cytochrome c [Betaproteobacteria bacterium]